MTPLETIIKTNLEAQLKGIDILPLNISGVAGIGKEQPLYSKILTPDGWTTMGEISIGEKVCRPDGGTNTVIGIHKQGIKDIYRVHFKDGTHADCGLDHNWFVKRTTWKKDEYRVLTTADLLELHHVRKTLGTKNGYTYITRVPSVRVEFNKKDLPLHPYLLGALIGDGSLHGSTMHLSSHADSKEIIYKCNELLPENTKAGNLRHTSENGVQQSFIRIDNKKASNLVTALKELGLHGKYSKEKFIPKMYMFSSIEDRISLLNGLMDTDGSASSTRNRISFSTRSELLADDVVELVKGLGGVASKHVYDRGKKGIDTVVTIFFTDINPFTIKAKKERVTAVKNARYNCIVSIEKLNKKTEQQCISLDGDHLYITDGYNTTHNTQRIKQAVEDIGSTFLHISLPAKNLEYWGGIPEFTDMPNIAKYSKSGSKSVRGTLWTAPEMIIQANTIAEKDGSCCVLLDDFHKLDETTSRIMYELLLERSIGDYKLHDKVAIICAMNDSEENGFEGMEAAIKDRLSMLPIVFNFDEWFSRFGNRLHHFASSFLKSQPKFALEDENNTLEQSASPRSWENLSKNLALYNEDFIVDNIEMLSTTIMTQEAVSAFSNHVRYMAKIDLGKLVKNKSDINLTALSELDKLLYAYIVNYVVTPDDAVYLIELLNKASGDSSMDNFIGFLSGEIAVKYRLHLEQGENSTLTTAQRIIIDKLVDEYKPNKYKLSDKQKKALEIDFKDKDNLLGVIGSYIL